MDAIVGMLKRSYWAPGRPREKTEKAFRNSLAFGLYDGDRQAGMARVISDFTIVGYLCDVFVLEEYRGRGLGKWLLETIMSHPDLKDVRRWILATDDAQELYKRYGFEPIHRPETWMERIRPFPGESS
jgi:GNAT superfamily N-acetyltransferase